MVVDRDSWRWMFVFVWMVASVFTTTIEGVSLPIIVKRWKQVTKSGLLYFGYLIFGKIIWYDSDFFHCTLWCS